MLLSSGQLSFLPVRICALQAIAAIRNVSRFVAFVANINCITGVDSVNNLLQFAVNVDQLGFIAVSWHFASNSGKARGKTTAESCSAHRCVSSSSKQIGAVGSELSNIVGLVNVGACLVRNLQTMAARPKTCYIARIAMLSPQALRRIFASHLYFFSHL